MEKKLLFFQNPNPRSSKTGYYLSPLAFIPPSNVIFPFWFVDKSALTYRSSSWTIPTISMQLYRYILVLYRYNFTTVDFQASCTGTCLCCTGTMCPLPLFKQVVPVHVYVVPVQCAHWCFPCFAGVPETSSLVRPHPQCFILASRTYILVHLCFKPKRPAQV